MSGSKIHLLSYVYVTDLSWWCGYRKPRRKRGKVPIVFNKNRFKVSVKKVSFIEIVCEQRTRAIVVQFIINKFVECAEITRTQQSFFSFRVIFIY